MTILSIYQSMNAVNKLPFMTSNKLLLDLAPGCHP